MLQCFCHLCVTPLGSLQLFHVFLVLRSTETDTALRCDLSSAEQSGRITSLHLLVTFLLMQQRKRNSSLLQGRSTASCLTWCPPGVPGPFLQSCCPGSWLLACPGVSPAESALLEHLSSPHSIYPATQHYHLPLSCGSAGGSCNSFIKAPAFDKIPPSLESELYLPW